MRKIDREFAVFVHIFKNSGTTVTQQIKTFYGDAGLRRENDHAVNGVKFIDRIREALQDEDVRAIAGHFKFFRILKTLDRIGARNAKFFSFVRDPVSRAVSIYNYSRELEGARHHALARDHDISAFLEALMDDSFGLISNHQSACLSLDGSRSFEAAKATITDHFAFVGLSDQLDATNDRAMAEFGFSFDASVRRNVSGKAAGLAAVSPATMMRLRSLNAEDQRLYDYVKAGVRTPASAAQVIDV